MPEMQWMISKELPRDVACPFSSPWSATAFSKHAAQSFGKQKSLHRSGIPKKICQVDFHAHESDWIMLTVDLVVLKVHLHRLSIAGRHRLSIAGRYRNPKEVQELETWKVVDIYPLIPEVTLMWLYIDIQPLRLDTNRNFKFKGQCCPQKPGSTFSSPPEAWAAKLQNLTAHN